MKLTPLAAVLPLLLVTPAVRCESALYLPAAAAAIAPEPATPTADPVPTRDELRTAVLRALDALWEQRVETRVSGREKPLSGIAQFTTIDGKKKYWGNESGQACAEPVWCFQSREGIPGAITTFLMAHAALKRDVDLQRARALGDTLLWVQDQLDGGWFQDSVVRDGELKNIQVWGKYEAHALPDFQGVILCDDSTSQSCALALIQLYEVTKEQKYLDGAIRFGNLIRDIMQRPEYANGGLPQAYPFDRALATALNQGRDPRNPDGPYHVQKTLNDNCQTDQMIVLAELFRVTDDPQWLDMLKQQVQWLLDVRPENGGWAQQYDYKTNKPCWARHKEPPAFTTGEHNVVNTLLWLRTKLRDAALRREIERELTEYVAWLRDLPQCKENRVHRYYNEAGEPVWANNYKFVPTLEQAGVGQPYCGRWDYGYAMRMGRRTRPDFATWTRAVGDLPASVIGIRSVPRQRLRQYLDDQKSGSFAKKRHIDGEDRWFMSTAVHCNVIAGILRELGG